MSAMMQTFKPFLRRTPVFTIYKAFQQKRLFKEWINSGKPAPPPDIVKQGTVKEYAQQYDLNTFIETGTYRGDMVGAVKNVFDEIYSIELGIDLFRQAQRWFKHITIRQGNSGDVLKEILHDLNQPCLY